MAVNMTIQITKQDVMQLPEGSVLRMRSSSSAHDKEYTVCVQGKTLCASPAAPRIDIADLHEYTSIYRPYHIIHLVSLPTDITLTQHLVDLLPAGSTVAVRWGQREAWQHEVVGKDAGNKSYVTHLLPDSRRMLADRLGFVGHEPPRNCVKLLALPF